MTWPLLVVLILKGKLCDVHALQIQAGPLLYMFKQQVLRVVLLVVVNSRVPQQTLRQATAPCVAIH